jgi:hypothetical protein
MSLQPNIIPLHGPPVTEVKRSDVRVCAGMDSAVRSKAAHAS